VSSKLSRSRGTLNLNGSYSSEPRLCFAGGRENDDPKTGLACFGPMSLNPLKRHPTTLRMGFIGTSETIEKAQQWISINSNGVPGDEKHPDFPGCAADRGFHTSVGIRRRPLGANNAN
jgi:hypothetical protein